MEDYSSSLEEAFLFLAQYAWIHNFQVTNVFKDHILKKIHPEWGRHLLKLNTDEINDLPFIGVHSQERYPSWPPSLHVFLSKAAVLSVDRTQAENVAATDVDTDMARGMDPKKLHEVSWMASHVNQVVCEANCNLIVDIGSGLGYLDHVLHQIYGHRVVGLEISDSHSSAAEIRAVKQGLNCQGIKSLKFDIKDDKECFKEFESLVQDLFQSCDICQHARKERPAPFPQSSTACSIEATVSQSTRESSRPKVCLIGLHCCGDLSSSVLALFHHVTSVHALCCVCCCYHKMAFSDGQFHKFPMSCIGQQQYEEVQRQHPSWRLSPFTLRLGAQETRSRWKTQSTADHDAHIRHVAYRGLLEMTDYGDPKELRQRVRKCDFSSFDSFVHSYMTSCKFSEEKKISLTQELQLLYQRHQHEFDLIEILTCLQVIVQPVIETLIYRDKLQWLHEQGHTKVQAVPVFDEFLSPRNLAIVRVKSTR